MRGQRTCSQITRRPQPATHLPSLPGEKAGVPHLQRIFGCPVCSVAPCAPKASSTCQDTCLCCISVVTPSVRVVLHNCWTRSRRAGYVRDAKPPLTGSQRRILNFSSSSESSTKSASCSPLAQPAATARQPLPVTAASASTPFATTAPKRFTYPLGSRIIPCCQ